MSICPRKFFSILMSLFLLTLACNSFAEGISLEEALAKTGVEQGEVLLIDDFSAFDLYNSEMYTSNIGKFIVLKRISPEKEFTVSKTPFSADFNGVDIGTTKVYLDLDAMALIPDEYRAKTVDEIGNILMFETFYLHAGTISSRSSFLEETPKIDDLYDAMAGDSKEESTPSALPEQMEEPAMEYKPVFTGYAAASVYNAEDGSSASLDEREFSYAELRNNPEASDIAETLYLLAPLFNGCLIQDEEAVYENALILMVSNNSLTESELEKIIELLSYDILDYTAIEEFIWDLFWKGATQIRDLDSKYGYMYDLVIEEKSLNGLFYLLNKSDYNSVSRDDFLLRLSKDYLGKIDMDVLEEFRTETLSLMDSIGWDPEILQFLLLYY